MIGQALIREIENLFTVIRDRTTKDEVVIVCPEKGCGDQTGNRSISIKTGRTNCWRCSKGGDFVKWAATLGFQIDETEAQAVHVDSLALLSEELESTEKTFIPTLSPVTLPKGFIPIKSEPDSAYTKWISRMARRKNLDVSDFIGVGVGFTRDSQLWEPYAIFPVFEWDRVVYFQGRTYVDVPGESTKRFPSKKEIKYGSSCWVYNIDAARKSRATTLIVVESILNVLSLRIELGLRGIKDVVPVAVFKHAISTVQEHKLMALKHVKEICIMYDADATSASIKHARKLMNRRKFSIAEIPRKLDGSSQDANDDAKLAVDMFLERKFFNSAVSQLDLDMAQLIHEE